MERTPRIIYANQEEIQKKIIEYLKQKFFINHFVNEVYLFGSLVVSQFGIYNQPEKNYIGEINYGSDVDLIIIADENYLIPDDWPDLEDYIFQFCEFGLIEGVEGIKEGVHKITAFVYRNSLENLPVANKHGMKGDVFDTRTRKEALKFFLEKHKNKLVYKK